MDEKLGLGAIASPYDVRDYRLACAASASTFPKEFSLESLSPMPDAKHQGTVSSCVAHALSTIIEWFSRWQGDEISDFSVGYIYGNRTNTYNTDKGMIIRDAVAAVCEYGDVIKPLFPYNQEVPTIIELFESKKEELYTKGIPHRFSSYYRVYGEQELKTALMSNSPVIIGMRWYSDMRVENGILTSSFEQISYSGLHAVVIYGWNEQGWLIQNSYGSNWGNKGRAIMPYDIAIREAYGVVDNITENTKILRIKELEEENAQLIAEKMELNDLIMRYIKDIADLNDDIERLQSNINALKEEDKADNEEKQRLMQALSDATSQVNNLTKTLGDTAKKFAESQEESAKKDEEIKRLENTIIEIKKPFSSPFGQVVAKVANLIINIYENIKDKIKK